jgi:hypothetical protein
MNMFQAGTVMNHGTMGVDAILYGNQNQAVQNYLVNNIASLTDTLTDAGRNFMASAGELYQRFNGEAVVNVTKGILRNAKGLFMDDVIRDYTTSYQTVTAKPIMQRWIMAHQDLRSEYHNCLVDGYADSYTDLYGNVVGEDHYDWRRVMNGVAVDLDADEGWKLQFFPDDLVDGDSELHHLEKVSILSTWELIDFVMENSQLDPTSIFGQERGK